jgi:hypothetical protein
MGLIHRFFGHRKAPAESQQDHMEQAFLEHLGTRPPPTVTQVGLDADVMNLKSAIQALRGGGGARL